MACLRCGVGIWSRVETKGREEKCSTSIQCSECPHVIGSLRDGELSTRLVYSTLEHYIE